MGLELRTPPPCSVLVLGGILHFNSLSSRLKHLSAHMFSHFLLTANWSLWISPSLKFQNSTFLKCLDNILKFQKGFKLSWCTDIIVQQCRKKKSVCIHLTKIISSLYIINVFGGKRTLSCLCEDILKRNRRALEVIVFRGFCLFMFLIFPQSLPAFFYFRYHNCF